MTKPVRISYSMALVIRNIGEGKPSSFGLKGQSAYGGLTGTMTALYRRKLVDPKTCELTEAGLEMLAKLQEK